MDVKITAQPTKNSILGSSQVKHLDAQPLNASNLKFNESVTDLLYSDKRDEDMVSNDNE